MWSQSGLKSGVVVDLTSSTDEGMIEGIAPGIFI